MPHSGRISRSTLRDGIDTNVSRCGPTALHFAAGCRGNVSDADRARFAATLLDHVAPSISGSSSSGSMCDLSRSERFLSHLEQNLNSRFENRVYARDRTGLNRRFTRFQDGLRALSQMRTPN